jgi:transaldolase
VRLFLDTANLGEIREAHSWGVLAGVTTNPTLIAREGADLERRIREICAIVPGPVSAEVVATDAEGMVREGERLAALADNVVVKIPTTIEGLKAIATLARRGIAVNATLVFSANQGLVAARAGARYVSPFVGRLDEIGHDGMEVVAQLVEIFRLHAIGAEVIAASIRHPLHVTAAARAGAHIATMPFAVLRQLVEHPLRDIGLERFLADWRRLHP